MGHLKQRSGRLGREGTRKHVEVRGGEKQKKDYTWGKEKRPGRGVQKGIGRRPRTAGINGKKRRRRGQDPII